MSDETTMVVIGSPGVGKTTFLATMFHHFIYHFPPFVFNFSSETSFEEIYKHLQNKVIAYPAFTQLGQLIDSSLEFHESKLDITFKQKKLFELVLRDIHAEQEDFHTQLAQATVILNVIDAAILMEGQQKLVEQINGPKRLYDLLHPLLKIDRKCLILFVLTKCEAWLKPHHTSLQKAFERYYWAFLTALENHSQFVAVLIPVKTLGCVEFSHIDGHRDLKRLIFVKKPNLKFAQQSTEQPLLYALIFALIHHARKPTFWNKVAKLSQQEKTPLLSLSPSRSGLWNQMMQRLGNQEEVLFRTLITQLVKQQAHNFKIYGNQSLFVPK